MILFLQLLFYGKIMCTQAVLKTILSDTLGVCTQKFTNETPLLGAIPELDSMAIMTLLMAIEEQFTFPIDSADISAEHFSNLGTLQEFIELQKAA